MKSAQPSKRCQESLHLKKCIQLIEEQTGWGSSSGWTQGNYERLREHIYTKSGIAISSSTLRRLFIALLKDNDTPRHPQMATKNALAAFIGYENWDNFVRSYMPQCAATVVVPAVNNASPFRYSPWLKAAVPMAVLMVIAGGLGLLYRSQLFTSPPRPVLTSHPVKDDSLWVVFDYDVSALGSDSVQLDFGDGTSQWLGKLNRRAIHEYKIPNLYHARLVANDQPLTEVTVRKTTRGWVGGTITPENIFYSLPEHFRQQGRLYAPPQAVRRAGPGAHQPYWTFYHNIRDLGVDGDNFSAEVRVKNDSLEGGISCYDVNVGLIGEKGAVKLEFMQPGCTVWADLTVGEVHLDGKEKDLSAFGQDFSRWRKILARVANKQLYLSLDGKPLYQPVPYSQSLGAIHGITLNFKGSGSVDYVRVYNAANRLVYHDEFP